MKKSRIRGGQINLAIAHRWGSDNPRAFVVEGPKLLSGIFIHGIQIGVAATEVNYAFHGRSRRLYADLIMDIGIFASLESPLLMPGSSIERVEVAIPAAQEKRAIGDGRRGV